jgi:two-component system, chemotaxis family, protein-glutamate methylesterase/glutaminase
MNAKKNILIVDDSKVIQKLLYTILSKEPDFEIIGICSDPFEAKDYISNGNVDCVILDLEMPKMDGLTFLKKLMQTQPVKTIILSSAIDSNPLLIEKLLSFGAHDVFSKPTGFNDHTFDDLKKSIRQTANHISPSSKDIENSKKANQFILIAASTGGTEGVKKILSTLHIHEDVAVIVIQHMAAQFTKTFADSLNKQSEYLVKEITANEVILGGVAYIAPGNFHIEIKQKNFNHFSLETNQKPHMHSVRPAADITFLNFPEFTAKNSTVIVLSGMGKDGADGLAHLKKLGAETIAEAESTCVVFGMPKAAIQTGCVDHILPINEICTFLQNKLNRVKSTAA